MSDYFHVFDEYQLFRYIVVEESCEGYDCILERVNDIKHGGGGSEYWFELDEEGGIIIDDPHTSNHIFLGWNLTNE